MSARNGNKPHIGRSYSNARRSHRLISHKSQKSKKNTANEKGPKFGLGIRQKGTPRMHAHGSVNKKQSTDKNMKKIVFSKSEMNKKLAADTEKKEYKEHAKHIIEKLMADKQCVGYLVRNVDARACEVIALLNKPRGDDEIAKVLDVKINTVRRILNIMQGFGITNYSISKNKDGWLSFVWEIDTKKADVFIDYVYNGELRTNIVTEECNDYFVCDKCYKGNKLILTFDAAYESNFRCVCDNSLSQISREKVNTIISNIKSP